MPREKKLLSSFVGGGVFPLYVSRMFGYKWSLIYVTTESLPVVFMCTDVSLIMLVTMVSSLVTGNEAISLVESASFTLTGLSRSLTCTCLAFMMVS